MSEEIKFEKICPACRKKYEADRVYCEECGKRVTLISQYEAERGNAHNKTVFPQALWKTVKGKTAETMQSVETVLTKTDEEATSFTGITYYKGEPKISPRGILGKLTIYNDKVYFKASFAGLGGFLAAKKEYIFSMDDIRSVREGTYAMKWPTAVIEMKNDETHSFAAPAPGMDANIKRAIQIIRDNLYSWNKSI